MGFKTRKIFSHLHHRRSAPLRGQAPPGGRRGGEQPVSYTHLYQEGEPEKVCFQVTLIGDGLEEHLDEISALIVGKLDSCDLENSFINDAVGHVIYPAQS